MEKPDSQTARQPDSQTASPQVSESKGSSCLLDMFSGSLVSPPILSRQSLLGKLRVVHVRVLADGWMDGGDQWLWKSRAAGHGTEG